MHNKSAFTLVEIVVAVAIIAVLAVLSLSFLNFNSQAAKNQAVQNQLDVVEQRIKSYKIKNGTYPTSLNVANTNS